ncbi:hypothetical protein [Massilia genomosp. 1]|uniref:Uncharacterized protein n=1 Tax=Massilia genomosp. 1 TaxID=2609280 RepID=A0ABX0N3W8_9BURK|nr:hypothetical protein [Massilia genomosp. 1]NHZ67101.1 hypothetical protein [Massilia genomosp. 1]
MGLFYLVLLLIWFGVLWWVVKGIARCVDNRHKALVATIIIAIVYPLPLADEIIGAIQLANLCRHQVIYKDPAMAKKRGARLIFVAHEENGIDGMALPTNSKIWDFVYESDKSLMLRYEVFRMGQGFLARNFQLNEGGNPLTFTGVCYPEEMRTLFTEFKVIN